MYTANMEQHAWNPLVIIHAVMASYALIFGAVNLIRIKKGDRPHRILGYLWVISMYFVCISSFWIRSLSPGNFSWIHGLSLFTIVTVSVGLYCAIRGRIFDHKMFMLGSYFGIVGALIGALAAPNRLIPQLAFTKPLLLFLAFLCICVSAALCVYTVFRASKTHYVPQEK